MAATGCNCNDPTGGKRERKCDLGTFVVSVDRLKKRGKPFATIVLTAVAILRWKNPLVSIIVIPCTIAAVILWPVYLLAMFLIPLPIIMIVSLIKKMATRKVSFSDYHHLFKRKDESAQLIAKRAAMMKAQEHLEMYLDILIEIQEFCDDASTKLESFFSLISWKKWQYTLLFQFTIIGIIFALFTIETRLVAASLLFAYAFFNSGFIQACKNGCLYMYNLPSKLRSPKSKVFVDNSDEETFEELEQKDFDMQIKDQEPLLEEEDLSSSSTDSEDLTVKPDVKADTISNYEPQQEKQRESGGLISKFKASIRRRNRKHGGNCASCNVEFSTILKKRNYCRHCGKSYCSKCCHQRVPKVVFGATAPAAYEERVLVCLSCYAFLMNRMRGTNTEIVE